MSRAARPVPAPLRPPPLCFTSLSVPLLLSLSFSFFLPSRGRTRTTIVPRGAHVVERVSRELQHASSWTRIEWK